MKRIFLILLSAILILSFAGCKNNTPPTDKGNTSTVDFRSKELDKAVEAVKNTVVIPAECVSEVKNTKDIQHFIFFDNYGIRFNYITENGVSKCDYGYNYADSKKDKIAEICNNSELSYQFSDINLLNGYMTINLDSENQISDCGKLINAVLTEVSQIPMNKSNPDTFKMPYIAVILNGEKSSNINFLYSGEKTLTAEQYEEMILS